VHPDPIQVFELWGWYARQRRQRVGRIVALYGGGRCWRRGWFRCGRGNGSCRLGFGLGCWRRGARALLGFGDGPCHAAHCEAERLVSFTRVVRTPKLDGAERAPLRRAPWVNDAELGFGIAAPGDARLNRRRGFRCGCRAITADVGLATRLDERRGVGSGGLCRQSDEHDGGQHGDLLVVPQTRRFMHLLWVDSLGAVWRSLSAGATRSGCAPAPTSRLSANLPGATRPADSNPRESGRLVRATGSDAAND
jgi:hypothetical protein